jgi:hypothetical protein
MGRERTLLDEEQIGGDEADAVRFRSVGGRSGAAERAW